MVYGENDKMTMQKEQNCRVGPLGYELNEFTTNVCGFMSIGKRFNSYVNRGEYDLAIPVAGKCSPVTRAVLLGHGSSAGNRRIEQIPGTIDEAVHGFRTTFRGWGTREQN